MRHFKISVLLLFISITSFSQTTAELDRRNGFKDIKLNTDVGNYKNLVLKKTIIPQDTSLYQVYVAAKGEYESIGSIAVKDLQVKTYKGVIYDIKVLTQRDVDLYKSLTKAFGKPYNHNKVGYGDYYWKTDNVRLTFRSHSKTKLSLVYHSYALEARLKEEKVENIETISSDF